MRGSASDRSARCRHQIRRRHWPHRNPGVAWHRAALHQGARALRRDLARWKAPPRHRALASSGTLSASLDGGTHRQVEAPAVPRVRGWQAAFGSGGGLARASRFRAATAGCADALLRLTRLRRLPSQK